MIDFDANGVSDLIISSNNGSLWYYKVFYNLYFIIQTINFLLKHQGSTSGTDSVWTKKAALTDISGVTNIVAADLSGLGRARDFVVISDTTADIYV